MDEKEKNLNVKVKRVEKTLAEENPGVKDKESLTGNNLRVSRPADLFNRKSSVKQRKTVG